MHQAANIFSAYVFTCFIAALEENSLNCARYNVMYGSAVCK